MRSGHSCGGEGLPYTSSRVGKAGDEKGEQGEGVKGNRGGREKEGRGREEEKGGQRRGGRMVRKEGSEKGLTIDFFFFFNLRVNQ